MKPLNNIFYLSFLVLFGCATSSTHVGIVWGRSTGGVASSDARKAQNAVGEFHGYLAQEHWQAVYDNLDRHLQSAIARRELENAFAEINRAYGHETSFDLMPVEPTEFLHRLTKLGYDDPKHNKGYEYYDAVVAAYKSKRMMGDLVYIIGVARADTSTDLRVSSIQIYRAMDVENRNTRAPVMVASVAYPKVMPPQ